jgi:membrane protease YdiL (CAAX protease family)
MHQGRETSAPARGSLTSVCIAVYLALHLIWGKAVYGHYAYVELRALFLIGVVVLLICRGRPSEIYLYTIGRILPRGRIMEIGLMLVGTVLLRLMIEWWHPFFISSPREFLGECLVAPFNEEIVFRGLFLTILLQQMPSRAPLAILLSALIFASVHSLSSRYGPCDLNTLISLLLLGCLLGWIFFRTRSVPFCILAHSLWNGFSFLPFFHLK